MRYTVPPLLTHLRIQNTLILPFVHLGPSLCQTCFSTLPFSFFSTNRTFITSTHFVSHNSCSTIHSFFVELYIPSNCSYLDPQSFFLSDYYTLKAVKMKSSMMILSGASLAMAGPLHQREPEVDVVVDVVTDVITNIVEYTVYATSTSTPPPPVPTPEVQNVVVTVTVQPTTSSAPVETPNVQVAAATSSTSSSTTVASAASSASATDFASVAVYHHNVHRANNSAPDVTYSETLAGYALQLSQGCVFEHDV